MSIANLLLALLLFLMGGMWLGWFTIDAILMGILALITAFFLLFEGVPVVYRRFTRQP